MCFVCFSVCVPHVFLLPKEPKRRCYILWNYRQLWVTLCLLGTDSGSSERAASTFNCWAISPASNILISKTIISSYLLMTFYLVFEFYEYNENKCFIVLSDKLPHRGSLVDVYKVCWLRYVMLCLFKWLEDFNWLLSILLLSASFISFCETSGGSSSSWAVTLSSPPLLWLPLSWHLEQGLPWGSLALVGTLPAFPAAT